MVNLGKIERISDLRTVWAHEALDFSKWLAEEENLAMLSDTIGIDVIFSELESSVGNFNVDIFATEEGSARKIVIENQLEDTDHDHLGKIITYAAGKSAEVIIWIVKRAKDEHRQAVEWLNQHTDENIGIFLLEIELWRIDNSAPAAKFNVVERPNDWAKTLKIKEGLSDTKRLQLEFWQSFSEYAFEQTAFAQEFSSRKAQAQHWYDLRLGSSAYHLSLTANTQKKRLGAEIYINDDKSLFEKFKLHADEIESDLNMTLDWRVANKACRILALRNGDIKNNTNNWIEYFDWYCEMALKFKEIAKKYDV